MPTTMPKANVAETTTAQDLSFWSKVFQQGRLQELDAKLKFGAFLRAPWEHLARLNATDAAECVEAGFLPLLPAQRRVRDRLDSQNIVAFPTDRTR